MSDRSRSGSYWGLGLTTMLLLSCARAQAPAGPPHSELELRLMDVRTGKAASSAWVRLVNCGKRRKTVYCSDPNPQFCIQAGLWSVDGKRLTARERYWKSDPQFFQFFTDLEQGGKVDSLVNLDAVVGGYDLPDGTYECRLEYSGQGSYGYLLERDPPRAAYFHRGTVEPVRVRLRISEKRINRATRVEPEA